MKQKINLKISILVGVLAAFSVFISCSGRPTAYNSFQIAEDSSPPAVEEEYNGDAFSLSQLVGRWSNAKEKLYWNISYNNGVMYCNEASTGYSVLWSGNTNEFYKKRYTNFSVSNVAVKNNNIWGIYSADYIFKNPSNFTLVLKSSKYYGGSKTHTYTK